MAQGTQLKHFLGKAAILLALLAMSTYLIGLVPGMQPVKDPRKFLFDQKDFSDFKYAIIGDSVFCSYYVDSVEDTIWKRFEEATGQPCFPAALNGATINDMLDAADYLATRLPANATVFVGLIPTRFVNKGIVRHRNYYNDFAAAKKSNNASPLKSAADPIVDRTLQGLLLYREPYALENFLRKKKGTFDTGHKVWDQAAKEKAVQQYRSFVASQKHHETYIDTAALAGIRERLAARNIKTVYVLSALNQGLIQEFSKTDEAQELVAKFRRTKDDLVGYFERTGVDYIDLFDRIDSRCFTDLVHLNTCGDATMAAAFADYAVRQGMKVSTN